MMNMTMEVIGHIFRYENTNHCRRVMSWTPAGCDRPADQDISKGTLYVSYVGT